MRNTPTIFISALSAALSMVDDTWQIPPPRLLCISTVFNTGRKRPAVFHRPVSYGVVDGKRLPGWIIAPLRILLIFQMLYFLLSDEPLPTAVVADPINTSSRPATGTAVSVFPRRGEGTEVLVFDLLPDLFQNASSSTRKKVPGSFRTIRPEGCKGRLHRLPFLRNKKPPG